MKKIKKKQDVVLSWERSEIAWLGWIAVLRDDRHRLVSLRLGPTIPSDALLQRGRPLDEDVLTALRAFLDHDDSLLRALPLAPAKTRFAARVRHILQEIPHGEVMTYGQVAAAIGRPKAARAVGWACHQNPVPIIVPCHRVVGARGWGGFAPGLAWKKRLLAFEGTERPNWP